MDDAWMNPVGLVALAVIYGVTVALDYYRRLQGLPKICIEDLPQAVSEKTLAQAWREAWEADPFITGNQRRVLEYVAEAMDGEGCVEVVVAHVAKDLAVSRRTVDRNFASLVKRHYLYRPDPKAMAYAICLPPDAPQDDEA